MFSLLLSPPFFCLSLLMCIGYESITEYPNYHNILTLFSYLLFCNLRETQDMSLYPIKVTRQSSLIPISASIKMWTITLWHPLKQIVVQKMYQGFGYGSAYRSARLHYGLGGQHSDIHSIQGFRVFHSEADLDPHQDPLDFIMALDPHPDPLDYINH